MMHKGIIRINPVLLLQFLDFIDGGRLIGVRYNTFTDTVDICIEHESMPEVLAGGEPPVVEPTYVTYQDAFGHKVTLRERD